MRSPGENTDPRFIQSLITTWKRKMKSKMVKLVDEKELFKAI